MKKELIKNAIFEAYNEFKARNELKKFILSELLKAINDDEPKDWITIKGNHIPILKGQTKKEAAKDFVEEKQKDNKSESKEDSKNVLEQSTNYVKSLPKKQQDAIISYTDDDRYTKINAYLRDERGNIDTKTEQTLKALDKAFEKAELTSDLTVYRGVRADFIERALKDTTFKDRFEQTFFKTPKDFELENIKNHFIGQEFTENGFMSTSYDKSKAFQDTEIMLTVNLKKGIKAMNISSLSVHDEAEILVNHGYKFIIRDVQIDKNPYGKARWNFILDSLPV